MAVRPATGEILAMVGSADFNNEKISGQINMAVAPRQPGSSIKPLTYLTAFSLPPAKIDDKTAAIGPDQRPRARRLLDAGHGHPGHPDGVPRWQRSPALCA